MHHKVMFFTFFFRQCPSSTFNFKEKVLEQIPMKRMGPYKGLL